MLDYGAILLSVFHSERFVKDIMKDIKKCLKIKRFQALPRYTYSVPFHASSWWCLFSSFPAPLHEKRAHRSFYSAFYHLLAKFKPYAASNLTTENNSSHFLQNNKLNHTTYHYIFPDKSAAFKK